MLIFIPVFETLGVFALRKNSFSIVPNNFANTFLFYVSMTVGTIFLRRHDDRLGTHYTAALKLTDRKIRDGKTDKEISHTKNVQNPGRFFLFVA